MSTKLKTVQAYSKRLKVKRSKKGVKIIKRTDGQDHFNSRENGKTGRNKRSDKIMSKSFEKLIKRMIP